MASRPIAILSRFLTTSVGALALLAAGGCDSKFAPENRLQTAQSVAATGRLSAQIYQTGTFPLQAYQRFTAGAADAITVYIEGDGLAWLSRSQPSGDPTPLTPMTLSLASMDPGANVVYLARPCQYARGPRCEIAYWTNKRYAPEIITAYHDVLNQIKATTGGTARFHLIGYSGGGGIAALIAQGRDDIASLRTVAGNTNTDLFTSEHALSPMTGSVNPVAGAAKLASLPQIHFIGEDDTLVPPAIAQSFIAIQQPNHCATLEIVPGATHNKGWTDQWPALLAKPLPCTNF